MIRLSEGNEEAYYTSNESLDYLMAVIVEVAIATDL